MWITPEVSSRLAKHLPLEEGNFGRGGFYLIFVFYVPFGDLGGEMKWATWKCGQSSDPARTKGGVHHMGKMGRDIDLRSLAQDEIAC